VKLLQIARSRSATADSKTVIQNNRASAFSVPAEWTTAHTRLSLAIAAIVTSLCLSAPAFAADYVPGMTCEQVGGFAESVAEQKALGLSLRKQIIGMRQSIPNYPDTQAKLAKIIRAIYGDPALGSAPPEAVGKAYERTCMLLMN
jgi:hypothetical protein